MKPNVLYLHSHDTGRFIQPHGYNIPTPAYQRLAEEGVFFRQNFCIGPTCSPSRAALLTGQTPHSCGQLGLAHRGFELQHPERHLAWTLQNNGYVTTLVGVQHVVRNDPGKTGYQHVPELKTRKAEHVMPAALNVLRDYAQGPRTQPFYLDVGFTETHRVFHDADPDKSAAEDPRYCLPPPVLPDTPETRKDMADFKASARVLDHAIGKILDALDEHGLAENTLVILTTDHGIAFPHMKCNLTDHGTGVLLIVRGPATAPALRGGKVVDALVTHLDVFPTVCDVTGIDHPDWLQGSSLIPIADGKVERLHDEIFGEVNYHAAYEPQRSVRTDRWRYIKRYDNFGKPILANCDEGLSKEVWMRYGWPEQDTVGEQLYDVVFDPMERHNLATDERYSHTLDQMRSRLERWMKATEDPLLDGDVPLPEGARANPQSDQTPRAV
jgi:N-sulfoglucosamine sulfohydrolase